ncbi:MAG: hypothetical protein P8Y68_18240 [Anaerolineales bacterium]
MKWKFWTLIVLLLALVVFLPGMIVGAEVSAGSVYRENLSDSDPTPTPTKMPTPDEHPERWEWTPPPPPPPSKGVFEIGFTIIGILLIGLIVLGYFILRPKKPKG